MHLPIDFIDSIGLATSAVTAMPQIIITTRFATNGTIIYSNCVIIPFHSELNTWLKLNEPPEHLIVFIYLGF